MRSHKGLRGFDDIIARTLSPGIDVTRCKLLAETNRTGRFESKYHITHVGQHRKRVVELQFASRRYTTSIIVDQHRVLLLRIEIGGQEVEAGHRITFRSFVAQRRTRSHANITQ